MNNELPPGLEIVHDFLSLDAEEALLEKVNAAMDHERTPVLRYGWNYNPADKWVQEIPAWLLEPVQKLGKAFDSISAHEYLAGRGIPPHIDSLAFGPEIYVLSLLGDSVLLLNDGKEQWPYEIPRRSLYVMSGRVRNLWKHAIEPVKTRRYSVVYRTKVK